MIKTRPEWWAPIHAGLVQIPSDGLRRLVKWIVAGKPMLTTGEIMDCEGHG